jgi:Ca2+-transporting ATPase
MRNWYEMDALAAVEELKSDPIRGLIAAEAARRLTAYGPNELKAAAHASAWSLFLSQFKNILIVILLIAAFLSIFMGHAVEAITIGVIVLFAVFLGFIQEYRAERALEALQKMAAPTASVLRDGDEMEVPARALVPGDIILIAAGDRIPADARLLQAVNLQTEEAALTGESLPVEKSALALPQPDLGIGDRKNMAYSGTTASYGRGKAVVTATGMATEFGKITGMLQSVETVRTPLQKNLDRAGSILAKAALAIVAVIIVLGVLRGQPFLEMLLFGVALAVAVVPEALPAVVTISLAIGVQRMVKRNALVRRLPTVETLGSTSVICSDKTGTLTKDEMTIRKIFTGGELFEVSGSGYAPEGQFFLNGRETAPSAALLELLRGGALASDARLVEIEGRWDIKGDPTEGALIVAAEKAGLKKAALETASPRIQEIPFTSETKRMTTLHASLGGNIAYSKGAPEVILQSCTAIVSGSGEQPIDGALKEALLAAAQNMAKEALRVLAVASKRTDSIEGAEQNMTLLGLVGMIDPPRPEAKVSISTCERAGIKPVMITGDHPLTAQAIASELGLLKGGEAVTGAALEAMSEKDLEDRVENIEVYARVSPAHKLRVVTALQKKGHIVAMTGDGINDAPALKKADIGVAMGITGTDVSKEVASMTLLDDNFASIVAAVEEGRHIFSNIKKYLMYLLGCNIGEILLMATAVLLGMPLPLTTVQILYVNLATDGLPALALSVDPPDRDLMSHRPRDSRAGIFTRPVVLMMLIGGIWTAAVALTVFCFALKAGLEDQEARTMTFVSLILAQFFNAYNYRSDRISVFSKPFANKWLNLAILWETFLLFLIVYLPFFHKPLGTYSLPLRDWAVVAGMTITVVPILELAKWMVRRGWFGNTDQGA